MTRLRAALRWFVTPQDDWISRFCSTVAAWAVAVLVVVVIAIGATR